MSKELKTNKGLAVIYDPHNLYQFLWYYCNQGKEKEWDALCLPNGYKGEYMHTYCENAGIFRKVFRDDTDYSALSKPKKIEVFIEMFLFYLIGKRKDYCKKILNQFVSEKEYDEFVVLADVGVVSGACVALGDERNVIILEDGITDYRDRPAFIPLKKIISLYMWQGFFLSAMGYCCPGWFRLKTDRECIKYSSNPSKMEYTNYREIRRLFDDKGTDNKLFEGLLNRVYPSLNQYDYENADILLMTSPLGSYLNKYDRYTKRIEKFIQSQNYKFVLLKKHPREEGDYCFGNNIIVSEVDNSIPAEVLYPYFRNREVVVTSMSSALICLSAYNIKCTILYLDGLYEESLKYDSMAKPYSFDEVEKMCNYFFDLNSKIIKV